MLKTFADLFCGIGGFRLALEREGLECLFSCDIDRHARAVYEHNFGEMPKGDIREIRPYEVPECDVFTGGFPCQPFSTAKTAGKKSDGRRNLFEEIMRIAEVRKPKVLILENVPGLAHKTNIAILEEIYKELWRLDYDVRHEVLNAAYFGIPQSRNRVYIVAMRRDLGLSIRWPEPTYEQVLLKDVLMELTPEQLKELEVPLEDCEIFPEPRLGVGHRRVKRLRLYTAGYLKRRPQGGKTLRDNGTLRTGHVIFDENGAAPTLNRTDDKERNGRILVHQQDRVYDSQGLSPTLHAQERNDHINIRDIGQGYEIHDVEGVSPAVMAKACPTSQIKVKNREVVRRLHIIEYKRLQGFPDDHGVSKGGRGYGQLGNAVIPKMIQLIYRGIKENG